MLQSRLHCQLDDVALEQQLTLMWQYIDTYLQFPPPGQQPTEHELSKLIGNCHQVFRWFIEGMIVVIVLRRIYYAK